MPATPWKHAKSWMEGSIMEGERFSAQTDVCQPLAWKWTPMDCTQTPQLCRAQWRLVILNYLNMHTNELGSILRSHPWCSWLLNSLSPKKLYVEAKCPTLMKMGEEEYPKSNSRNSHNRKLQVFSSRFDPWANRLPTTNWVSGCLTATTAARHPLSSHRSPCRPSQFAPCTFWKLIRMFKRGEEPMWENHHNIPDPTNPDDFALDEKLLLQACYIPPGTELVYLTLQSGYAWVDQASIQYNGSGIMASVQLEDSPKHFLNSYHKQNKNNSRTSSSTLKWHLMQRSTCPLTLKNDKLSHHLPFSLRRTTLQSNRLMHKFTFRFLRRCR